MRTGILVYDPSIDRFDVLYAEGPCYGGLRCGDTMEALINGEWIPTRIEYADGWYLIGVPLESLSGLQVRI